MIRFAAARSPVRRLALLLPALAVLLGGSAFAGIAAAAPGKPAPGSYTITKTFGPYNGAAQIGQPGSVPDGRALAVYCGDRESVLGGNAKVNRKTTYGTTRSDVLTLDVIGVFYDTDRSDISLGWGAYAIPTRKPGWNSVTITVTCRRQ